MTYYIIASYLIVLGAHIEEDSKTERKEILILIFAPLIFPVLLGMLLGKYYSK